MEHIGNARGGFVKLLLGGGVHLLRPARCVALRGVDVGIEEANHVVQVGERGGDEDEELVLQRVAVVVTEDAVYLRLREVV